MSHICFLCAIVIVDCALSHPCHSSCSISLAPLNLSAQVYRKKWFTPELQEQAKRSRRDFREAERLKAMVKRDAALGGA